MPRKCQSLATGAIFKLASVDGEARQHQIRMRGSRLLLIGAVAETVRITRAAGPDFEAELAKLLSDNALIITPTSPHFGEFIERYSFNNSPDYSVVVIVDTEDDVSPSSSVTGHGPWGGLSTLKDGMSIWLRYLSRIGLTPDGQYVHIGGGLRVNELVRTLCSARKQTVCWRCWLQLGRCVGLFMGEYGLGLDQIVSARVVLANGTAVTVSDDSHSDLFWGLKGAGHNFGRVTELKLRVYDNIGKADWAFALLIFTHAELEALFDLLNAKNADQPSHLSFDAIILLRVFSNGFSVAQMETYIEPFQALSPLLVSTIAADYPSLIETLEYGVDSATCTPNHYGSIFSTGTKMSVPSDMRNFYNIFNAATSEIPEFAISYVFIESYAVQAMQAVPATRSTAYAHRHLRALFPELDALVDEWGEKMRSALLEHQPRQESYVNYSVKQESRQAMYEYCDSRLSKLRRIKNKYDPHDSSGFYVPI
ncbi:hypothetical protein B0H63DRAFT_446748 [Podospora didyma]|uniref:FAD-binding PCMH-type domain-containing protein n=1 Tax=Podospora didyma TaxID=330526 RepID=A0AAE0U4H5_9PEZI|nr:hypothetical protein B0H63DRAFT_446748 [Podospora didyma]